MFDGDPEVSAWLRAEKFEGSFEDWLEGRYPKFAGPQAVDPKEGPARLLEAVGEGVILTALEHSADADSLAVLRPRLSGKEKAVAIAKAFGYAGRPYDFNFDFISDDTLVCSELVYKAYEQGPESRGLRLPLEEMAGRVLLPPTKIAEIAVEEGISNPDRRFDLIAFFDGREWEKRSVERDFAAFKETPGRPKWHVWVQALESKKSGAPL